MNSMRHGFTMIELIFVIVIIGILVAIAIPKLAASKDDAIAATCGYEIGQFISEVAQAYITAPDFATWSSSTNYIDVNITNIKVASVEGNGITNAKNTSIHGTVVEYMCDGEPIIEMLANKVSATGNYNIDLSIALVGSVRSPAAKKAISLLVKQYGAQTKILRI